MDPNRRACLRTIAALAAALPISHAGAAWRGARTGAAMPALVVRQEALAESRLFATAWPQHARRLDLGTDVGQALFGPAAVDWARLRAPVLGLTTPGALFCLEQVAAACGVRTVGRVSPLEADTPAGAVQLLHALLHMPSSWKPLIPAFDTSPDRWVAWLMAPRAALQLDLSRKRRAAPSFLDPLGGRAGRSPALGAL